jgi:hypothetical protein
MYAADDLKRKLQDLARRCQSAIPSTLPQLEKDAQALVREARQLGLYVDEATELLVAIQQATQSAQAEWYSDANIMLLKDTAHRVARKLL